MSASEVDLTAGTIPVGFKGNLQQTLNVFADSLSATIKATFISGQLGGSHPSQNIGPWAKDGDWFFWDPVKLKYQRTKQGVPIGLVLIWGGQGAPVNWLLCDGRAVSRTDYSDLYVAIGTTWGAGDNQTTFNLPPKGVFMRSADSSNPVNTRGGSPTAPISSANLPALKSQRYGIRQAISAATPSDLGINIGLHTDPRVDTAPVVDKNGVQIGGDPFPLPIMPSYCAANFIIKYQ